MLDLNSNIILNEKMESTMVDNEIVMLDVQTGSYYALNSVGTYIWELLKESRNVEEICGAVVRTFDVEKERCEKELFVFLEKLHAENLIIVT